MNVFKYLFFCLTFLSCCQNNSCDIEGLNIFQSKDTLRNVLLNGYYTQLNDRVGLSIFNNHVYIVRNIVNAAKDENIVIKIDLTDEFEVNESNSKMFDFKDSLGVVFGDLIILNQMQLPDNYDGVHIGQVSEGDTLWSKKISKYAVNKNASIYKNEFQNDIGENLLLASFKKALTKGVFFKNESGFYILLLQNSIYFIIDEKVNIEGKIMLHLMRDDNTFNNLSFYFKNKEISEVLSSDFPGLKIAKSNLPTSEKYARIRIGQFTENGNLWVKNINLESVFSNKLLKYKNEFKEFN